MHNCVVESFFLTVLCGTFFYRPDEFCAAVGQAHSFNTWVCSLVFSSHKGQKGSLINSSQSVNQRGASSILFPTPKTNHRGQSSPFHSSSSSRFKGPVRQTAGSNATGACSKQNEWIFPQRCRLIGAGSQIINHLLFLCLHKTWQHNTALLPDERKHSACASSISVHAGRSV